MLAQQLAGRFDEWVYEQTRHRERSLQAALYDWLYDEAIPWTAGSYELYLQIVVIIVADWGQNQSKFTYQHPEKGEIVLTQRDDDWASGRHMTWECLRRDQYERALFIWQQKQGTSCL